MYYEQGAGELDDLETKAINSGAIKLVVGDLKVSRGDSCSHF